MWFTAQEVAVQCPCDFCPHTCVGGVALELLCFIPHTYHGLLVFLWGCCLLRGETQGCCLFCCVSFLQLVLFDFKMCNCSSFLEHFSVKLSTLPRTFPQYVERRPSGDVVAARFH